MPTLEQVETKVAKKREVDNEVRVESEADHLSKKLAESEAKLAESEAKIEKLTKQKEEDNKEASDPNNVNVNSNWNVVFAAFKEAVEKETKEVEVVRHKHHASLEKRSGKRCTSSDVHEAQIKVNLHQMSHFVARCLSSIGIPGPAC